jgi:3-methyladenine DNA glycosylase/8-oxoguanine DNA glycosylase
VPNLLALDEEPVSFPDAPRLVRALHQEARGMRFARTGRVFERLLPLVLHQFVPWQEAARAFRNLVHATSEPAPGPADLLLPPTPERLAHLPEEAFTSCGVLRKQARTLREVGWAARRLEELPSLPLEEAARKLLSVQGIGPWTAGMALLLGLGHTDAVPLGDFHLPHTVAFHLAGEARATDERMLELLEPYRGQRGRIARLFKFGAKHAPRYGPRRPLRKIPRRGR